MATYENGHVSSPLGHNQSEYIVGIIVLEPNVSPEDSFVKRLYYLSASVYKDACEGK